MNSVQKTARRARRIFSGTATELRPGANRRTAYSSLVLLLVLLSLPLMHTAAQQAASAAGSDQRAEEIIREFERKQNLEGFDVTAVFTLVQKKEGEANRVIRVRTYRRDSEDAFTIIFLYPPSEEGKGYLRKGEDLFLYLPSTREFVYRNRKDDIAGSDARTDIFGEERILEQYNASYIGEEKVNQWTTDVVRLDAKVLDVSFPVQKLYIRRSDGLPVKIENFSASETLMRTYYFISYESLPRGKYLFTRFMAINHLEEGQQTLITNENISTDPIPDYVFTKAFLEEQSR